jgi:hypothetical protein
MFGNSNMHHHLKVQILGALRNSLHDLESLKLVSADDPDVLLLRQNLRKQIIELENKGAGEHVYEVAA